MHAKYDSKLDGLMTTPRPLAFATLIGHITILAQHLSSIRCWKQFIKVWSDKTANCRIHFAQQHKFSSQTKTHIRAQTLFVALCLRITFARNLFVLLVQSTSFRGTKNKCIFGLGYIEHSRRAVICPDTIQSDFWWSIASDAIK